MVIATGAAIVTVATGGVAAAAGAGIGISAGAGGGVTGAVATGTAIGASGGAIAGAAAGTAAGTAALTGAATGAVAGGTAAAGVGGSGAGVAALVAGTGGWGLLALGTSVDEYENKVTYDCWKPVLHDQSREPSRGMLLKDVINHPHVAKVTVIGGSVSETPSITLENIWNERFEIEYVVFVETGKMACHAKMIQ